MYKARAIVRMGALMLAGALMGVQGCCNDDAAHEHRTACCRALDLSVTAATAGQQVVVRVRATNVSSRPIAIVTMTHPSSRGDGAPFVYYGGKDLAVLFWGHVKRPWGVFSDVEQHAVSVQELGTGEAYETEVALDDPLDEHTAWGSLYAKSPASPEGEAREVSTFPVSRVLVVMAYYDMAEVRAFLGTQDGDIDGDRRIYSCWAVSKQHLSPEAYARGIARKIECQSGPWDGCLDAQQVQQLATAGPVILPRTLALRCRGLFFLFPGPEGEEREESVGPEGNMR